MADGFKEIIKRLEQQKDAIDRALSALKEMDGDVSGSNAPSEAASAPTPKAKRGRGPAKKSQRKGGISAEGRARLSESLKARWAAKRADQPEPAATKKATGKRRGRKPNAAK